MEFSKALDKLGDTAITREDEEDDIGAAFQKFAVVTKELSALMKNMVSWENFITIMKIMHWCSKMQRNCVDNSSHNSL